MCVIQYVSLYNCHTTTLPYVILTSWARPLSLLPWRYACFVFLRKNEGSKLDVMEDTHAHVIAYVYGWVGRAVTSHSGSVTGTCRYMPPFHMASLKPVSKTFPKRFQTVLDRVRSHGQRTVAVNDVMRPCLFIKV